MIKDVLIEIKGTQGIDGDFDTIEFVTDGRFGIKNGRYYITYDEGAMFDTGDKVKTAIYIKSEDSVVLQRTGTVTSRMLVEKGKRNSCFYNTPVGEMVIGIFGESIENNLNDFGGEIKLKYTIDSDLRLISRNEVNINIREVEKDVNTCS
ncbi:MAG: DUF1934 domain-containing protein [Clostridia bacterium]|nr:DUF1934 domain-containing protein [Clostridia bacterium]